MIVSAIGYSRDSDEHRAEAIASIRSASDLAQVRERHRKFWAAWWPRSAIFIPDQEAARFYWLQLYKLGSAVRAEGPMLDLAGPWWGGGPWPAIWWNLNVQLAYQPCAPANRPELLDSLVGMIEANADRMGQCVPAKWGGPRAMAVGRVSSYDGRSLIEDSGEAGNLAWALAVAWDGYRLTGDRRRAERLLPLMARAAAFHTTRAQLGPDGRYHLPPSLSPESGVAADCLYELGPMRWLLRTLVAAEAELGWKHPDQAQWREVLEKLVEFPADEHGWLKGTKSPVSLGHRHWSHLLHVYPLRDFDPADERESDLVRRSVLHWTSNRGEWRGYSGLGASAMFSVLADAERARPSVASLAKGNTLYREAGPCIETPLFGAAVLQESLLTWDKRGLRFFASAPSDWKDAAFLRLRAPLGLAVSARRAEGSTAWIHLQPAVSQTVRIEPRFVGVPEVRSRGNTALRDLKNGWLELDLIQGEDVLLVAPGWNKPVELGQGASLRILPRAWSELPQHVIQRRGNLSPLTSQEFSRVATFQFARPRAAASVHGADGGRGGSAEAEAIASHEIGGISLIVRGTAGRSLRLTPYGDYIVRVQVAERGEAFLPNDFYPIVERHDWPSTWTIRRNEGTLAAAPRVWPSRCGRICSSPAASWRSTWASCALIARRG